MFTHPVPRALDNPFWSALLTRHAHLAVGNLLARRYPAAISRCAGMPDAGPDNIAALESLVAVGEEIGLAGPFVPKLADNWETVHESQVVQMIRADGEPLPEGNHHVAILGAADVADMLALVDLAKPCPFRRRTIELGTYVGIRERGRLVAMAGERSWVGDYRELSAVCTHPDVRGRGYARAVIARVVNRMLRAGERAFLHVRSKNAKAKALYDALGFRRRTEYPVMYAKRVG